MARRRNFLYGIFWAFALQERVIVSIRKIIELLWLPRPQPLQQYCKGLVVFRERNLLGELCGVTGDVKRLSRNHASSLVIFVVLADYHVGQKS